MEYRIGYGFDLHRLEKDRPCIIGGVEIPFQKGLAGHSDADVLIHALMDALLGSLALGDIGTHFPDTDPEWKDADSRELLRQVLQMVQKKGWEVQNVDSTVIAEEPKLNPYIDEIRKSIAGLLEVGLDAVSVKATTNERLGYLGSGEGIASHVIVSIKSGV